MVPPHYFLLYLDVKPKDHDSGFSAHSGNTKMPRQQYYKDHVRLLLEKAKA